MRFKQTSETVWTDGRVPGEIRERLPDCGAGMESAGIKDNVAAFPWQCLWQWEKSCEAIAIM